MSVIDTELDELDEARRDERTTAERDAGLDDSARMFDPGPAAPAYVKVCDRLTPEGEICGSTISSDDFLEEKDPEASARAAWARHVRFEHPKDPTVREKQAAKSKSKRDKAPSTDAPPSPPSPAPATDRATTYARALQQYAFMAWLVPSTPIDDFDLHAITQGAPMLATGLDGIGDRHKMVRTILDAALGEGGGPYGATIMAAIAIAAPIMAHHGALSLEVGARWGSVIGILEVPPPPTRPAPSVGAPTTPEPGPAAPNVADDAFAEVPLDNRTDDERIAWPTDLPDTPSAAFVPLGADQPVAVPDGVRSDDATAAAHAFA